jgi:hypothetical protein
MAKKTASSQAAWALLTEGVSRSRVETHRIQLLVERVMKLVEASDHKEHIYQVAGDAIEAMPKRINALELALDRTSLALSKMGEEFFDSRLPLSDKVMVDEAIEAAFGGAHVKHSMAAKVAERYMRSDLNPPLGRPGGPCQVVKRIDMQVTNPSVKESLIDEIEHGYTFTNADASRVYGPEIEFLGGIFRKMQLSAHAQYRMDLRGITVALVQRSLMDLSTAMGRDQYLMSEVFHSAGRGYRWDDPKRGVTIVIDPQGRDTVRVVTVYQTGGADPKPPGEGGCEA